MGPFDVGYQNDHHPPGASVLLLVTSLDFAHALGGLVLVLRAGANVGNLMRPWCCAQRWRVTMVAWGQVHPLLDPWSTLGISDPLCLQASSSGVCVEASEESPALKNILRHMQLCDLLRLRGKVTRTTYQKKLQCISRMFLLRVWRPRRLGARSLVLSLTETRRLEAKRCGMSPEHGVVVVPLGRQWLLVVVVV